MNPGAKLTFPLTTVALAYNCFECWFKLAASPVTASVTLFYNGNSAVNGNGWFIDVADQKLTFWTGGVGATKTTYVWPDTNWHLVQGWLAPDGLHMCVDGQQVLSHLAIATTTPAPFQGGIGADSANTLTRQLNVAWPAYYSYAFSAAEASRHFLAASDPNTAILGSLTGGGGSVGSLGSVLQQILASVRKTY